MFVLLALIFKDSSTWNHEIFEVIFAFAASIVVTVVMARSRTDIDTLNETYRSRSETDELTGLFNKAAGMRLAGRYVESCMSQKESAAIVIFDLDEFKQINDTMGRQSGDLCLSECGRILLSSARKDKDIVVRFGGDEFFILFVDIKSKENILSRLENIRRRFKILSDEYDININFTAGVYFLKSGESFDECFAKADKALYLAKNSEKNRYGEYKEK